MKKITNAMTYEGRTDHEINNQPSETIPDQSMNMQTILQKYASGQPLGGREGAYQEGDEYLYDEDDLKRMDLTEIQELKDQLERDIRERYDKSKRDAIDRAREAEKQKIIKEYEEKKPYPKKLPPEGAPGGTEDKTGREAPLD